MGINPEDIKKAKKMRQNQEKDENGLIRKNSGIAREKTTASIAKLRNELGSRRDNLNNRVKAMTAHTIEESSSVLAQIQKEKAEIVFIFDKSDSCKGTEEATIQGFYDVINQEQKQDYNDLITTVLFNHNKEIIHRRQNLDNLSPLKYYAEGWTALYDAVCSTIIDIERCQKHDEEKPKKTLVVIMTDGLDNESHKFTHQETRELIKKKKTHDWQFIFLAAYENAKDVASSLGIDEEFAETYDVSHIDSNFKSIIKALEDIHTTGEVSLDWSEPIIESRPKLPSSGSQKVKKLLN